MFTIKFIGVILSVSGCCLPIAIVSGQVTHRVADASDPRMIQKSQRADGGKANQRMHGKVLYSGGEVRVRVVEIDVSCPTFDRLMATVDSKGRFGFSFDSNRQSDAEILSPGCSLYGSLDGYSSEKLDLANYSKNEHLDLGQISMTPLSKERNGLNSVSEHVASSDARKHYRLAIDKGSHNVLGVALKAKGEHSEAIIHLEKYIASAPNGANVEVARKQIDEIRQINSVTAKLGTPTHRSEPTSEMLRYPTDPVENSVARANAPVLANASAYTCIESVQTIQIGPGGQLLTLPLVRLDVALTDGKEIYSAVGKGVHFSDSAQRDLLYSFRTSGLFNAVARTLTASEITIDAEAAVTVNGRAFSRYSFQSTNRAGSWAIKYGSQAGVASQMGWFLVDGTAAWPGQPQVYDLPNDVQERVTLESALHPSDLRTDTAITGRVIDPVTVKGHLFIDAGALVEGHARPAWSGDALVIELDRVLSVSGWIPFYATLSAIQWSGIGIRPKDQVFPADPPDRIT